MGEIIVSVLKWIIVLPFFLGAVIAITSLLYLGMSAASIVLNGTVLKDLFILIQMWLPFNLNVITTWITTVVVSYVVYRMSIAGMLIMSRFTRG